LDGIQQEAILYGDPTTQQFGSGIGPHAIGVNNGGVLSLASVREYPSYFMPGLWKFDDVGDTLWTKTYDLGRWSGVDNLHQCSDGGLALSGFILHDTLD
jgi:hypothetical protein